MSGRIRLVLARLGLDAHWRGSVVVARALRDAGMEVIFLGNQVPEAIVETAVQEAVDVIGLSSLSGNHLALAPRVPELLRRKGTSNVLVVLGGAVPPRDLSALRDAGIDGVFGPGSSLKEIISFIQTRVGERQAQALAGG
ncbi:MAG: cobalamin B12-binding domain-containing protein [Deltaproteobacteria bacterium]|nr:cobalamin B12-binding domain-containing protein [Deltaproteobacteria bacterium]